VKNNCTLISNASDAAASGDDDNDDQQACEGNDPRRTLFNWKWKTWHHWYLQQSCLRGDVCGNGHVKLKYVVYGFTPVGCSHVIDPTSPSPSSAGHNSTVCLYVCLSVCLSTVSTALDLLSTGSYPAPASLPTCVTCWEIVQPNRTAVSGGFVVAKFKKISHNVEWRYNAHCAWAPIGLSPVGNLQLPEQLSHV